MLEILYLSVAVATGYQAQLLLRRAGPGQRAYAMLLVADGVAGAIAAAGPRIHLGVTAVELLGAVAIFGFVGLVMVPPMLRDTARRALARDRLGLAAALTRLRELLSPGMGARQELELIEVVRSARSGDVDGVIAALRAQREVARQVRERSAIDDRIVFTLLTAGRWRDAADAYERGRADGGPASAPLAVEMVRAYGELGDLERAVEIVAFLESIPGFEEPPFVAMVARARMIFLAYAGRPAGVAAALGGGGPLGRFPGAVRAYWLGTAHHFAGDIPAARAELGRAVKLAGRDARSRQAATDRLITPILGPRELAPPVAEFAARAEKAAAAVLPGGALAPLSGPTPATLALVVANVAVFALVTSLLGSTEDGWVLARAGANLHSARAVGEPWRLVTSTFLHVGLLHLALNMIVLWSVGRLVERMLGWLRFTVVYMVAGIGGSAASAFFGAAGISAGASGAIFGILGAAIAELILMRRQVLGRSWRRLFLGNLVTAAVAQLAIGVYYPIIDQSAHVGGFVVGTLMTFLVSRSGRVGRSRLVAAVTAALFGAAVAATAASGVAAAITPYGRTLERSGWVRRTLGPASLEIPGLWIVDSDGAGDALVKLEVRAIAPGDVPAVAYAVKKELTEEDHMLDVEDAPRAGEPPPGWSLAELRFVKPAQDGAFGGERFQLLLYTRGPLPGAPGSSDALFVSAMVPRAHLGEARPLINRVIESVRKP